MNLKPCVSPLLKYLVACSLLMGSLSGPAAFAQTFPDKPVHIVVPFAPGAALDVITRVIGEQLQTKWGQPVIIDNRVGASGNIGTAFVAHAAADGYTLLASPPPPLAINQFLFKSMPFKLSDLTLVTVITSAPNVLVARPDLPVSNLNDVLALARSDKAKLNYASSGVGGTPHLTMEWLKSVAKVDLAHVPYNGGVGPALNDIIAGHVDLMFANLSDVSRHVEDGKLKALAVASAEPIASLPGIAPVSQTLPGILSFTWYAVAAPAGTPKPVVDQIAADIAGALKAPVVLDRLRILSLTPVGNSPAEATTYIQADAQRWHAVIDTIGLQPE